MKYLNQSEYAEHRGISQQRVNQLIRDGYLKGALKTFGNRQLCPSGDCPSHFLRPWQLKDLKT